MVIMCYKNKVMMMSVGVKQYQNVLKGRNRSAGNLHFGTNSDFIFFFYSTKTTNANIHGFIAAAVYTVKKVYTFVCRLLLVSSIHSHIFIKYISNIFFEPLLHSSATTHLQCFIFTLNLKY